MADQQSFNFDRTTFDLAKGKQRKEEGIAQASLSRSDLLDLARNYAIYIAKQNGEVTSDDVFMAMLRDGLDPTGLGPAAGAVFRTDFIFTGQWKKSQRVSNHASDLRVWKLKGDAIQEAAKKPVAREGGNEQSSGAA